MSVPFQKALYAVEPSDLNAGAERFDDAFKRITGESWRDVQVRERSDRIGLHVLEHTDYGDGDGWVLSNGLVIWRGCDGDSISCGLAFEVFAHRAKQTAKYPGFKGQDGPVAQPDLPANRIVRQVRQTQALAYLALGLMGEAGEYAEKVKKLYRGDVQAADQGALRALELGDVLWYLAMAAYEEGTSLTAVAVANMDKLASRRERGVTQGEGDTR